MPTPAPITAVFRHPNLSVHTLTTGEQKNIIPIDSEFTHAVGKERSNVTNKQ